jgi:hypothetical protein
MNYKEIEELAGHRPVSAWVVKLVGDAIAAEREACAKVCEAVADEEVGMAYAGIALCCADNIRARGQTKPEPETVSPAEHRRRTNAPWNDKASY